MRPDTKKVTPEKREKARELATFTGLTQRQIAAVVGMSQTQVSYALKGIIPESRAKLKTVSNDIADDYSTLPDEILFDSKKFPVF